MRLSRPRVILRAALLAIGGAFMLWRAFEARAGAAGAAGPEALLLRRIAVVEGLVGILALGAAFIALLALRRRKRHKTLRLGDVERGPRQS